MEHQKVVSLEQAQGLLENVRLSWKKLTGKNTLAYWDNFVSFEENKVLQICPWRPPVGVWYTFSSRQANTKLAKNYSND